MILRLVTVVIIFCLFPASVSYAMGKEFYDTIKRTVVFLGNMSDEGEYSPYATGFLVNIQGVIHLVTAKHVVMGNVDGKFTGKLIDKGLFVFFNTVDGKIASRSIDDIKRKNGVRWVFHNDECVDIAVIPFPLVKRKDDVKTIPDNMFCSTGRLFELCDIFYLSYQPGIKFEKKIFPITRNGIVSLVNDDKTFYMDGFVFPGNSGSPVFIKPFPANSPTDSYMVEGEFAPLGCRLVGVVGAYIPYQEKAVSTKTGRIRMLFEENTGLSKVWSFTFIKEIIESDSFKEQLSHLKQRALLN